MNTAVNDYLAVQLSQTACMCVPTETTHAHPAVMLGSLADSPMLAVQSGAYRCPVVLHCCRHYQHHMNLMLRFKIKISLGKMSSIFVTLDE